MIALQYGPYEAEIKPEIGGAIGRFSFEKVPVLRLPMLPVEGPRQLGSFAMVPYANRIEHGQLHFLDRVYPIALNFGDHPHPLHGHGWKSAWQVISWTETSAVIGFDHEGGEWPWAYTCEQSFTLGEGGLRVRLSVRNRSQEPMPVSLGFHPYFPRTADTVLQADVDGVWLADTTMIPTEHVQGAHFFDLAAGARLGDAPFVDNCFTGWRAPAQILQPDSGIKTTIDAGPTCSFFHCFIAPDKDFLAAEPVSAMPNAFNRPEDESVTGAHALAPGERFSIEMRLAAERL